MMSSVKQLINDWILPIFSAIVLAFIINKFVFFNIEVPTPSMYPTIKVGDHIFVTKIYNFNNIKRGNAIVFYSEELHQRLIKRVIGLPGETVEIKPDHTVWINGSRMDEPYVKNNGGKIGTYKVPPKQYFLLGDNRADSFDSRYWANTYIPTKDIQGKAQITIYPFNRIGFFK